MNRFDDGRFDERRAFFRSKSVGSVLENIKSAESLTWEGLADIFDVSTYTIRHGWRNESESVPASVAWKIKRDYDLDLEIRFFDQFEGQSKGGSNSSLDRGNIPEEWSPGLAEFYGALLGDGCIYSNMNSICITGNARLDEDYIRYLRKICISEFDITPKIRFQKDQNVVRLTMNSRKISRFLCESGFKSGEKVNKELQVPNQIIEEELLASLVRGLFDTDGGVYRHPNTGVMLDITAKNDSIHRIIVEASDSLDLPNGVTSDRIQLYGEEKLDTFFRIVGTSNFRNIKRYMYYKENKELPEVSSDTLLKSGSNDIDVPFHGFMV